MDKDNTPERQSNPIPVYTHGYQVRIRLKVGTSHLKRAMRLGDKRRWEIWSYSGCKQWRAKGSRNSLHQRKPSGGRPQHLAGINRAWGTLLYGVILNEDRDGATTLTLKGTREDDIERVLSKILKLAPEEWAVDKYRDRERYTVLTTLAAHNVAQLYGGHRKKTANKEFLLDTELPFPTSTGRQATAQLKIYRATKGATAPFRMELGLHSTAGRHDEFTEADAILLEQMLRDIITKARVTTLARPSRWEPQTAEDRAIRMDPNGRQLNNEVTRGKAVDPKLISTVRAYAPGPPAIRVLPRSNAAESSPSHSVSISRHHLGPPSHPQASLLGTGKGKDLGTGRDQSREERIYRNLVKEIMSPGAAGMLSEVPLGENKNPIGLTQTIIDHAGESVGVAYLGAPDWQGGVIGEPVDWLLGVSDWDSSRVKVVIIPEGIEMCLRPGVFRAVERWRRAKRKAKPKVKKRPVVLTHLQRLKQMMGLPVDIHTRRKAPPQDELLPTRDVVAGYLAPTLASWRQHCELTGERVIIITGDIRPDSAKGHCPTKPGHRRGDYRVRSSLGDAGRHSSHLRFFIETRSAEPIGLTMLKDEAQGRPGRLLFTHNIAEDFIALDDGELAEFLAEDFDAECERFADDSVAIEPEDDDPFFTEAVQEMLHVQHTSSVVQPKEQRLLKGTLRLDYSSPLPMCHLINSKCTIDTRGSSLA